MTVYLDTSVVLRVLLRQKDPLALWGQWESAYSSELLALESRRVLDRLRLEGALVDDDLARAHEELARIEATLGFIPVTRPVLRRASLPMPTAIRSLDAIHLASALLFQESRGGQLVFATHDVQQGTAARALGFRCVGS
ncbi:MAG: type II toxin-antitoxin system VapC family toxin [Planctomycetes bacterium]|nr:type II toxin-antitoxin system VapC family toxin [Planctomycetota bacterium]